MEENESECNIRHIQPLMMCELLEQYRSEYCIRDYCRRLKLKKSVDLYVRNSPTIAKI